MKPIATSTVESTATKYTQSITSGKHTLTADEPIEHGGADGGPAPYALLLSAVGACTSITLRMYAERKGWDLGQIHIDLRLLKDADGSDHIERDIRFGATLTDEQRQRLAEIADKTPVTKTVRQGAPIKTTIA
jgi:putative redox protein